MWTKNNNYIIQGSAINKEMDMYHLIIATTYACNLRCKHCYLPHYGAQRIPIEHTKKLISEWSDIVLHDKGVFGGIFHLKGGEPLLDPDFGEIISSVISKKILRLMITTNGTIYNHQNIALLRSAYEKLDGHVIINVSLDGGTELTHDSIRGAGNYSKTLRFLQELQKFKIPIHINFVVTRTNVNELNKVVNTALQNNVTQVNFLPFVAKGHGESFQTGVITPLEIHKAINHVFENGDEAVKKLLIGTISDIKRTEKTLGEKTCECVVGYKGLYYITPELNVFSCPNLMSEKYSLGNLQHDSIKTIHLDRIGKLYKSLDDSNPNKSDYSCKGAVIHYKENNNKVMVESNLEFNDYLYNRNKNTKSTLSFCFSRNI